MPLPINGLKLTDVTTELGLGSTASLQDCFDNATGSFDPTYATSGVDSLKDFRNYENEGIWDIANIQNWDNAIDHSPESGANTSRGLYCRPDGLKMYYSVQSSGRIYQYSLATPFDLLSSSYDNKQSPVLDSVNGFFFKTDGTRIFVTNIGTDSGLHQYDLNTAWDISTIDLGSKVATNSSSIPFYDVSISSDGIHVFGVSNNANVIGFELSTPWAINTATNVKTKSVGLQVTSVSHKFDGSRLFLTQGGAGNTINQYDLSTAWDVATIGAVNESYSFNESVATSCSIITPDGNQCWNMPYNPVSLRGKIYRHYL